MKRGIAFVLAGVLMLGLCGCGNEKEKMLTSAEDLNCAQIYESIQDNRVLAEDTYRGQIVTVTGSVTQIYDDGVQMLPIYPAFISGGYGLISMKLSPEEMKKVHTDELITVVGKIDEVEDKQFQMVTLDPAYVVGTTVQVSATVGNYFYSQSEKKYYLEITTDDVLRDNGAFHQTYLYDLGEEVPDKIVIAGVTVEPDDRVEMEATAKKNYSFSAGKYGMVFSVESVNSITAK